MRFAGTLHQFECRRESVDVGERPGLTMVDGGISPLAMSFAWFRPFRPFDERCDPIAPVLDTSGRAPARIDFRALVVNGAPIGETMNDLEKAPSPDQERRVRNCGYQRAQNSAIFEDVKAARAAWIASLDTDGGNDSTNVISLIVDRPSVRLVVEAFERWHLTDKDGARQPVLLGAVNAMTSRLLPDSTPRCSS